MDADVVYGIQTDRKGAYFERISGNVFYSIINYLLPFEFPRNLLTARLMTRRYVRALLQYQESSFVIGGLWVLAGFVQIPLAVIKNSSSPTTYDIMKKLKLFSKIISSYSSWPLYAVFFGGVAFIVVSLLILAYIIFVRTLSNPIPGWSSLMASIWFIGGSLLSSIGIVGIYIQKVFEETKRRPNFIVREVYQSHV